MLRGIVNTMKSPDPATAFDLLTTWFDAHARDLPWRKTTDPWAILLCEVMSQQTPVARVEPTWRRWLDLWPTPADLAGASGAEVLLEWNSMGYPRRALRLRECAVVITERYDGKVPSTRDELLGLPGIGPYTADAILAFAFHERSVVLDTNIRRVLARWHGEALPRPTQTKAELNRAESYVPAEPHRAWRWNAAIMEFGALVCTARSPLCTQCPLSTCCLWNLAGQPADEHAATRPRQGWEGTNRQARGAIMAVVRESTSVAETELRSRTDLEETRFETALASLVADGLLIRDGDAYCLPH